MSKLLEELYREHKELREKLDKIEELIFAYGGKVPEIQDVISETSTTSNGFLASMTWKEKILHALANLGQPSPVRDISDYIAQMDTTPKDKIHKAVTLYTSSMNLKGEIEVDKSSGIYKYFLKK